MRLRTRAWVLMLLPVLSLAAISAAGCLSAADQQKAKEAGAMRDWAQSALGGEKTGAAGFLAADAPPISFKLGGQQAGPLLRVWKRSVATREAFDRTACTTTWTDVRTGLKVWIDAVAYKTFPAVDWVVYLENTGPDDTPVLEDIQALDLSLASGEAREPLVLHQIRGDDCSEHTFLPEGERRVESGTPIRFMPNGGRPSNGTFPFFTLTSGERNLVVAIGWTGQWAATIDRGPDRTRLVAGMEKTHLVLHPGERIRTPRIVLLQSSGDPQEARNRFRQLLLAHYVPQVGGKPTPLWIASNTFDRYNGNADWRSEKGQLAAARYDKDVGVDTYWLDAAWFEGGFPGGVGNWTYGPGLPNGLKPVGDLCHTLGLRVAVWFEPERVAVGTKIMKEHPEFVFGHGKDPEFGKHDALFRLDDPAARKFMTDLLSQRIADAGIDIYRDDFNIDPLPFWRAADPPDRQGMTEIRYVEGLYAMWDELKVRHPGLLIDNCASGGRRIDIETAKRAVVMTRSDTACLGGRAAWDQAQSYGLSLYYPAHTTMVWSPKAYDCRSGSTNGSVTQFDYLGGKLDMDLGRTAVREIRANRDAWYGDFYPLTPCSIAPDQWLAWQLHRADLGAGLVLAFRRPNCESEKIAVALRGLDAKKSYALEFVDEDYKITAKTLTGEELMSKLELVCPKKESSVAVRYKETNSR